MDQLVRQVFLFPMLLIATFVNLRDNPQRLFVNSDMPIAQNEKSWKQGAPLPTQRYDFGGAVADNKLYVVGGLVLSTPWLPTNRVEYYDPPSNTWHRVADFPEIVHHPGVVGCENDLYVVSGYRIRVFPTSDVYRYDVKENTWVKRADIPIGRGALGVACVDGKIYAMGGESGKKQFTTVHEYDTKQDRWTEKTSMPTAREHFTAVAAGGKIHVIGGLVVSRFHPLTIHEVYDPVTDTWTKAAPLPRPISGYAAVASGGSIYLFGGASGDGVSNEVYQYHIATDTWERRQDMPKGRYGLVAGAIQGSMYVVGGNTVVKGNFFQQDTDIFTP